jgi:hypothetical protein
MKWLTEYHRAKATNVALLEIAWKFCAFGNLMCFGAPSTCVRIPAQLCRLSARIRFRDAFGAPQNSHDHQQK